MTDSARLVVVGGGLAGCEAALQAARCGVPVTLYEMKPVQFSPAHESQDLAELVCSNSLRGAGLGNAVGLLKEEMRRLGSLVIEAADETAVPAGGALAVDRHAFARRITEVVEAHPEIEIRRERVPRIPEEGTVVLATGPLTDPELASDLQARLGEEHLYFYDAISPIVYADSIDHDVAFRASRWEDGEGDYLNLPLDRAAYGAFVDALVGADTVPLHPFEAKLYFEGCLPVEEMARRGPKTLSFGPMKPIGLVDPRTGERPHAVVQLRQEDKRGVLYNLVGFQTKLRVGEQKRVLRTLPGLEKAVFARFGSVHRNTYLNAPRQLLPDLQLKARPGLYVAGQIAGVEGYVESAALGFLAGLHAACALRGEERPEPDVTTAHGALLHHLRNARPKDFQPMNVNFGLFPPLEGVPRGTKKRERNQLQSERGLAALEPYRVAVERLRGAA
ncbi:MAG: methylenetetrahydrofolate--tRNA-(uracil(54)-C(5))-methyltransferase (FADH(2)-oxidizing) TrmFO [Deltaproteobacteria bacterium]|nr:methylenetetrahydrofolate--tRNA-(uracil(54)-C(5))-methyltransferase (FADH(2)-oxidizing) TrmFO [Deltaproteobacteria bacterium]MBW2444996.1 methylenetetrahydrofolate--tRNA-(uracil(54)-C(5))-methyltransferase (FADH(2)-oxidizing) TrmFO [Deltaproteobacteria bacterium]